jgi:hypothetical protein
MREQALKFLTESSAACRAHSGRTLLEHLVNTEKILAKWGCDEDARYAGLFHSIYGTNAFGHATVTDDNRTMIVDLIGARAEELVYAFHVAHRPNAFLSAYHDLALTDRLTSEIVFLDETSARQLLEIECANLIEQNSSSKFLRNVLALRHEGEIELRSSIVLELESRINRGSRSTPRLQN